MYVRFAYGYDSLRRIIDAGSDSDTNKGRPLKRTNFRQRLGQVKDA